MANRVKEDEKNERIIRNLLKLPENRRCINCNSLGPQYVCTNFWTFVCTSCSGIHREFTHRVKSISMAKFTSQEVSALQGGGNASAKEIYLKEWDPQRHSAPDSSNLERLREFIKHVYVDRRYTGERSFDKPPRVKMGELEDSYENRRTDTYRGGSRSPPYEDTYERRYRDRPSSGGRSDDKNYRNSYDERSPGYDQENRQYGDYRRSPVRTEIVNDWRREDRSGNGRRSEDSRISEGASKLEVRSPDSQKDQDMSSPPMVRPVRDILGDNVSPLRVIEPPKVNDGRAIEVSARTQRTASSSSLASSNDNPTEAKRENLGSLIDFDAVPEPSVTVPVLQTQQTAIDQPFSQPIAPSNGENWASFDSTTEVKLSQVSTNANSLESVLSQLSVPTSGPGHVAGVPGSSVVSVTAQVDMMSGIPSFTNSTVAPLGHTALSTFGSGAPSAAPVNNYMNFPHAGPPTAVSVGHMSASSLGGAPVPVPMNNFPPFGASAAVPGSALALPNNGVNSFVKVADLGQWSGMQPQQNSLFPASGIQPTAQPSTPPLGGAPSSQPWNSSLAPNIQGLSSSTAASKLMHDTAPITGSQPSHVEVQPGGRKELPADLFTATYRPVSVPLPGWQTVPPHGFGFPIPYNTAVPMPTFPHSSKSTNPFDLSSDVSPVQPQMFLSMASLQGALPNVAASSGLLRTSSLNTPPPTLIPPHSLYPSAMLHQAPSYASSMPPGANMGQQISSNLPSRHQAGMGLGTGGPAFSSLSTNQQLGGIYSAPATPNAFSSVGGNPFG